MALTYAPNTAREGFDAVADNYAPRLRDGIRTHYVTKSIDIERGHKSSVYIVKTVKNHTRGHFILVTGVRRQFMGDHEVSVEPQTWVIKYEFSKIGRLDITDFYQSKGEFL